MWKLVKKITLLSIISLLAILLLFFYENYSITDNKLYKLDTSTHIIFLGNSHVECAINDSLITHSKNFAQSADTYFYIYYKIKKIVEANSQIDTVFLDFPNSLFQRDRDTWVYGDEYLGVKYPKYSHLISMEDQCYLFYKNPSVFLISLKDAIKNNYDILSKKSNIYDTLKWGGYLYLKREEISQNFKDSFLVKRTEKIKKSFSNLNYNYFQKILSFCKDRSITVILFIPPLHYLSQIDDIRFGKDLMKKEFKNISLWDYNAFELQDYEYGDLSHLNYKGAITFSHFINNKINRIDSLNLKSNIKQ